MSDPDPDPTKRFVSGRIGISNTATDHVNDTDTADHYLYRVGAGGGGGDGGGNGGGDGGGGGGGAINSVQIPSNLT